MIRIQIRGATGSDARGTAPIPRWGLWLGLALATAFGFVLVAVGIGLVLLLAPVAVAGVFYGSGSGRAGLLRPVGLAAGGSSGLVCWADGSVYCISP